MCPVIRRSTRERIATVGPAHAKARTAYEQNVCSETSWPASATRKEIDGFQSLPIPHRGLLGARTLATSAVEPQAVPASRHALIQQTSPVVPCALCPVPGACTCRASALACTGPRRRPSPSRSQNPMLPVPRKSFGAVRCLTG